MDSPFQPLDYTSTAFEYPTLTKIHGPPSYQTLTQLKKQLKANAQSVSCTLGNGAHGHLGLVLTPAEYAAVSTTPYEIPTFPGPFSLPRNVDGAEAMRRECAYFEKIRLFRQVQDVNQALIRQIIAAVDKNYLDELRDETTNRITKTIPEILCYLFDNFADVNAEDVCKQEDTVSQYNWNIAEPPMEFFKAITDLQKMATAANVPRSQPQLISIGIQIIQRTGDFEKALLEWYEKDPNSQTWLAFKRHFTTAHKALRKVRGKTIKQTSYFHANQLVRELNDNITQMKSDILDGMSILQQDLRQDSSSVSTVTHASTTTQPTQTASAVAGSTASNEDLLRMIKQLQAHLALQSSSKPPPTNNTKRIVTHYCWTHGACGHPSNKCRNKKVGHQDEATFDDKMGGSSYYCKIAAEQKKTGST